MLFADSREAGSVSLLTNPEGVVRPVVWGTLCEMVPPGSAARGNLLIIMYNGNLSRTWDHFSSTRPLCGSRGGIGSRLVRGLTYVGWSIRQGAAWAARALRGVIESMDEDAIVYPGREDSIGEGKDGQPGGLAEEDSATSDSDWGGGMEAGVSHMEVHPAGPADEDVCWSTMGGASRVRAMKDLAKAEARAEAKERSLKRLWEITSEDFVQAGDMWHTTIYKTDGEGVMSLGRGSRTGGGEAPEESQKERR
jgi:hypothetical protein